MDELLVELEVLARYFHLRRFDAHEGMVGPADSWYHGMIHAENKLNEVLKKYGVPS